MSSLIHYIDFIQLASLNDKLDTVKSNESEKSDINKNEIKNNKIEKNEIEKNEQNYINDKFILNSEGLGFY
jgi:hypothetical protein